MLVVFLLSACGSSEESGYPYDDQLRLNHIQVKGTHNSYHVAMPDPPPDRWVYTQAPLDVQLSAQGVRQFELDVHYKTGDGFHVYHHDDDNGSTCDRLTECLQILKDWSDAHPGHHALFAFIEPKEDTDKPEGDLFYQYLDEEILSVWPRDRVVTPDDLQGSYDSLMAAVAAEGWPTLGETRGKALFIMLDLGVFRREYTRELTGTQGRVLFAQGLGDLDFAGFALFDAPVELEELIALTIEEGVIVRTRADNGGTEVQANDYTRFEAALRSGAHLISTDIPAPVEEFEYFIQIPDGIPSRCNPLTAPRFCTPESVEDPRLLDK